MTLEYFGIHSPRDVREGIYERGDGSKDAVIFDGLASRPAILARVATLAREGPQHLRSRYGNLLNKVLETIESNSQAIDGTVDDLMSDLGFS